MYPYRGLQAFGDDEGTLAVADHLLDLAAVGGRSGRRRMRRLAGRLPVVWMIDDERANREWFRDAHRDRLAVATFSRRGFFKAALDAGLACDAIVTDIFFPRHPPASDDEADRLLAVYDRIAATPVARLGALWREVAGAWCLDGFEIARDALARAVATKEYLPVFLYSRKASLLLGVGELLAEPAAAVRATLWLVEKPEPGGKPALAARAAGMQRERIAAALRARRHHAPPWRRWLMRTV